MAKAISIQSQNEQTKPSFWSVNLEWRNIWAVRRWIVLALALFYAGGGSINHGPSMNYLGVVYVHNWFARPTTDGQIFVFTRAANPWWYKFVPWQQQIKRRVGITPDNKVIYEGDNTEWSRDNRDEFEPVPMDHIVGVVIAALSPQRIANLFTSGGRFYNSLILTKAAIPNDNQLYAVVRDSNECFQIRSTKNAPTRIEGDFKAWASGSFAVYFKGDYGKFVVDASRPQNVYVPEQTMYIQPVAAALRSHSFTRISPDEVEVSIRARLRRDGRSYYVTVNGKQYEMPLMPPVSGAVGVPK